MWILTLLKSFFPQIAIALVVLALTGGGYLWLKHSIVAQRDAYWMEQVHKETVRVEQANADALNASRRRIAELDAENTKLETTLDEINVEAAKDPHATDKCLGIDSVRRLGR